VDVNFSLGRYHVISEYPKMSSKVGMAISFVFTLSDGREVTTQCEVSRAANLLN